MALWDLVLVLIALCVAVWAAKTFLPESAQPIKTIVVWLLIIVAVYVLLSAIGVIDALRRIAVPHL